MIVANRRQPLPTEKAAFAGGIGKTSRPFSVDQFPRSQLGLKKKPELKNLTGFELKYPKPELYGNPQISERLPLGLSKKKEPRTTRIYKKY